MSIGKWLHAARNGDYGEESDINIDQNHNGNTKHHSCNRMMWTTVMLLIVTILMMVVMIPHRISSNRLSKAGISKGDRVVKNTAVDNDRTITHQSSLYSAKEESICGSLDKNMPFLLSILRGGKLPILENDINKEDNSQSAATITDRYGYLFPFRSEQRFPQLKTLNNGTTTVSKNDKPLVVPGFNHDLIMRAFVGKRIYFIGDSTSRILFVALRRLLMVVHESSSAESSSSDLTYGRWIRNMTEEFEESKHQWKRTGLTPYLFEKDGTYLELFDVNPLYFAPARQNRKGHHTNSTRVSMQKDFLEMLKTKLIKPDVIIFNAGMHLLHLTPMRALKYETYASWVHYESSLLDQLLQVGLNSGASALIAKSTNRICDQFFPNDMKRYVKQYYRVRPEWKECLDFIKSQEKNELQKKVDKEENFTVLSQSQKEDVCKFGVFDESGASYLNERMHQWVNHTQFDRAEELALDDDSSGRNSPQSTTKASSSRSLLQYFNDHDIESCNFTEARDGRHYPKLSFVRLHLLAILLDCILPR